MGKIKRYRKTVGERKNAATKITDAGKHQKTTKRMKKQKKLTHEAKQLQNATSNNNMATVWNYAKNTEFDP